MIRVRFVIPNLIPFKERPTASATQQSFATDTQASDALSQWMQGMLKPILKSKKLMLDIPSSRRGPRSPGHNPLSGKVLHIWRTLLFSPIY